MTNNKSMALAPVTKFQELDRIAEQSRQLIEQAKGDFEAAHAVALALKQMREGIAGEVISTIHGLQNSRLGFKTDNPAGYPVETVRDCFIEATLRGVKPVGNEFNIIKSQCYITKEGYQGKIARAPFISEFKCDLEPPKADNGKTATVSCRATWKKNGVEDTKKAEIPVRLDSGSTVDNILGKAERKFLKRVWEQMTGKTEPDGDADEPQVKPAKVDSVETVKFGTPKQEELV